jgi:hypothetical protein
VLEQLERAITEASTVIENCLRILLPCVEKTGFLDESSSGERLELQFARPYLVRCSGHRNVLSIFFKAKSHHSESDLPAIFRAATIIAD